LDFDIIFVCWVYLGNKIGAEGAARLATCLESNSTITSLNLEGMEQTWGIYLRGNAKAPTDETKMGCLGSDIIFVFWVFFYSGNQIGDKGAARLATCLESNSIIMSLNLGGTE